MDNKDMLKSISKENTHKLQKDLEDELKIKKEDEQKKLDLGDRNTTLEVIERLFKSSKLTGWIKSKNYQLYNQKNLYIIINMSGKDDLISSKKDVVLKNGEIYIQNKHYLAIKKEYSEKVFMCAFKVVEEFFNTIPTLYKIYISIYTTEEEKDEQICVLSMEANKDQYNAIKDKSTNIIEKVDFFQANYSYDTKTYDFKEIEPVATPVGEASLEKTMATKVNANTSFYGNTVISTNSESISLKNDIIQHNNSKISTETKISSLSGSMMLNKSQLNINDFSPAKSDFEQSIEIFFTKSGFKIISEEKIGNNKIIKAKKSLDEKIYLINVLDSNDTVKEENLKTLFFKSIKENIEKTIFISSGAFALDSVNYANVNSIEIFDKEKLNKLVSQ